MRNQGERLFQDRQHLRQRIDADQRAAPDRGDTADVGGEVNDLADDFVGPVEAVIVGGFAENDIGHGGDQGHADGRKQGPLLNELKTPVYGFI